MEAVSVWRKTPSVTGLSAVRRSSRANIGGHLSALVSTLPLQGEECHRNAAPEVFVIQVDLPAPVSRPARGCRRIRQAIVMPPSATIVWPVVYEEASDSR